jgi:hypothetical protein
VAGPFLRTPLRANIDNILDLNTKEGRKYFESATESILPKDNLFDVEPNKFQLFMTMLATRANDIGLMENGQIALVPPDPATPLVGPFINVIVDYGRKSLEEITAWEATFVAVNNRLSQNSKILFDLLMKTLSPTGLQRIQVWREQFMINGQEAGLCLLKVIVRESYLDSNATVSTIRLNLTSLDDYIRKNGSDLVAFNAYVQSQVDGLSARGQTTQDLIVNLFKGYKAVSDEPFKNYLQQIENGHEDGSMTITAPLLMNRAVNFYKNKLTREEWEEPSDAQKEVLALRAQVETLSKASDRKQVTFELPKEKSTPKPGKGRGAVKKAQQESKPKWLTEHRPPSNPKATSFRTWSGTKWYWCEKGTGGKCDGKWRAHKPSECKGLAPGASNSDDRKRKASALKLSQANAAIIQQAKSDDDDGSEYDSA